MHKLTIWHRLAGLNEYTRANRTNAHIGASMKRTNEELIIPYIRRDLKGVHFDKVDIDITWYEPTKRRDPDNIFFAIKFILDALVKCNINNKDIVITPIKEANNVTLTISASKGLHYNSTSTKITVNVRLTNAYINGDVNGDGKVNSTDYIVVRKYILKQTALSGTTYERADVNSDQKVNSIDYITIRKIILKKS